VIKYNGDIFLSASKFMSTELTQKKFHFDDLPYDQQFSAMLSDNLGWTSTVAKQMKLMGHSHANLNSSAIKFVSILSMFLGI
jgi:Rod binding domain-containing protein